jgi:hypothetical protein
VSSGRLRPPAACRQPTVGRPAAALAASHASGDPQRYPQADAPMHILYAHCYPQAYGKGERLCPGSVRESKATTFLVD